jgi:hypothetical protein
MKPKMFISFDYENDKRYKFLLNALSINTRFDLSFSDRSSGEIQSDIISVVKSCLSKRINTATHTLVIIGKDANGLHRDSKEIGYRNWINFEVAKSKESGNKIIAVKINRSYDSPEEILGAGVSWVNSFSVDSIVEAMENAR